MSACLTESHFICVAWCLRLPKTPVTFLLWRQLWQHSDICPWCSQAIPTMTRKGEVIIGPTRHDWTIRGKVVIFGGNCSLVVIVCSRAFCAFLYFLTLLTIRQFCRMKIGMIIGTFCKPKFGNFDGNGTRPGERCETKWRIFSKIHPNVRLEDPGTEQNFRFGLGWPVRVCPCGHVLRQFGIAGRRINFCSFCLFFSCVIIFEIVELYSVDFVFSSMFSSSELQAITKPSISPSHGVVRKPEKCILFVESRG